MELSSNPWECDCRLRPLQHWLVNFNVPYTTEPQCAGPARLKGKAFGRLAVDEFACPPEVISSGPRYVEAKSGEFKTNLFKEVASSQLSFVAYFRVGMRGMASFRAL